MLLELSTQLLDLLNLFLLAGVSVSSVGHHIVLVQLHNTVLVRLIVLSLHDLVNVLSELQNNFLLLLGRVLLLLQVLLELMDLRAVLLKASL